MFSVYAVDPDAYAARIVDGLFRGAFGFDKGRLISRFPKQWKEEVVTRIQSILPAGVRRTAVLDHVLKKFNTFSIDERDRDFLSGTWCENAVREHLRRRFAAIVCKDAVDGIADCLSVSELSEDDPLWCCAPDRVIPRTESALALSARLLLEHSREVMFLDPYFLHGDENLDRWMKSLAEFLRLTFCAGVAKALVEVHLRAEGKVLIESFVERLRNERIDSLIPRNNELRIIRWNEFSHGDALHARYILTELGGLRYDAGLDQRSSQVNTDISRVGREVHERRLRELSGWDRTEEERAASGRPSAFRFQDAVIVQSPGKYSIKRRLSS